MPGPAMRRPIRSFDTSMMRVIALRFRAAAATSSPSCDARSNSDARELFDRREAGRDLGAAVVPERAGAARERGALDLLARRVLRGERRELLGHLEELEDADSALVTRLVAAGTAALTIEAHAVARGRDVGRDPRRDHLVGGRL